MFFFPVCIYLVRSSTVHAEQFKQESILLPKSSFIPFVISAYVDEYSPSSYFEVNKYVENSVYVKVFQKRNSELIISAASSKKLLLFCKVQVSLEDEQNRCIARHKGYIFDFEVQCPFVFTTETLIRQTSPPQWT